MSEPGYDQRPEGQGRLRPHAPDASRTTAGPSTAGRLDVLGPTGMLLLQRSVGNLGVTSIAAADSARGTADPPAVQRHAGHDGGETDEGPEG